MLVVEHIIKMIWFVVLKLIKVNNFFLKLNRIINHIIYISFLLNINYSQKYLGLK